MQAAQLRLCVLAGLGSRHTLQPCVLTANGPCKCCASARLTHLSTLSLCAHAGCLASDCQVQVSIHCQLDCGKGDARTCAHWQSSMVQRSKLRSLTDPWCLENRPSIVLVEKLNALLSSQHSSTPRTSATLLSTNGTPVLGVAQRSAVLHQSPLFGFPTVPSHIAALRNELADCHDEDECSQFGPAISHAQIPHSGNVTLSQRVSNLKSNAQYYKQFSSQRSCSQLRLQLLPPGSLDISHWEATLLHSNCTALLRHLARGQDVNAIVFGWATPLMCACYIGSTELVQALLAAGAEVNKCARVPMLLGKRA